jgi:hypothetical protein
MKNVDGRQSQVDRQKQIEHSIRPTTDDLRLTTDL